MKTLLLMSGGVDSTAIAAWLKPDVCLTLNYGQNAANAEIGASKAICDRLNINHSVLEIDCRSLGAGEMSGSDPIDGSPVPEWWPFRNQLLLTLAAAYSAKIGVTKIIIGSVSSDSIHADGTENFYNLANQLLEYQELNMQVEAPAINLTSLELINVSAIPKELIILTHSCHRGSVPCSQCRGCKKRYDILVEIGIEPKPLQKF